MTDALQRLQQWFKTQCDGNWEHSQGVSIGTLDNPGWVLKVDLIDTYLEDTPFPEAKQNYEDETEWMICRRDGMTFEAFGGPRQLEAMIDVFLQWAESVPRTKDGREQVPPEDADEPHRRG